ncbi:hypothetical protein [Subtercola frigoramans]|uniref:SRPBCC family protein n=1 Tax=Subtercola frigoramans TaxID=120298 RepID=A0ABS2L2I6_9MICO|nr:hypothetical protein [Subtercola frigoramans]MBM7471296.1 hypothetical protein [Subtercola frigoramans]
MKVMLKLILDCEPDAAWRALQSPAVFREVSAPLLTMKSLEPGGFAPTWPEGKNRVEIDALGLFPLGRQIIDIDRSRTQHPGVRIVRDKGRGVTGALRLATVWDHRMAVAADPAGTGKTLYRDRLVIGAGPMTPALWASLWAFWQLRGIRLRELAPTWAFDPEIVGADEAADAGAKAAEQDRRITESSAEVLAEPPVAGSNVLGIDPDLGVS